MTSAAKRKVSITLDGDLIEEVDREGGSLSATVNTALRLDLDRRRRRRALGELLDRLADEDGPLDTAEDEAEIARFMRLLGGPDSSASL